MSEIKSRVISLVSTGQLHDARLECHAACKSDPANAELWFMLSAICGQTLDYRASEKYCRKALELNPSVPGAYYNLAIAQRGQGNIDGAITSLEKALQLQVNFTAALYELGNIYVEKHKYENAIEYYRKAINYMPNAFQAYTGLAIALEQVGDIDLAISACIDSLAIQADQVEVIVRLAGLYNKQGNTDIALDYYNRAIDLGYENTDVYIRLGLIYALKGNIAEVEKSYRNALAHDKNCYEALTNLALLFEDMQNNDMALEYIERAYKVRPNDEIIVYNYAKILASARKYTRAQALYSKLLDENPEFCEAAVNLGNLVLLSGNAIKAQELYKQACSIRPDYQDACSNMLMSLNYTSMHTAKEVRDAHYRWADKIESEITRNLIEQPGRHERTLPLRVGYVSPDFRNHSVAYFLEGILRYSDKSKFVNYCYSDVRDPDEVTSRFKRYSDQWRDIQKLDNKALADLVLSDEVDILIDLCGHISGNRLPAFSLKPAPIQITYLGYPNTTGLNAMDYRIVDKWTDPSGSEELMSEKPLYISPCFLAYAPCKNSPEVSGLPAKDNEYITFGSFNNLAKMTDEVVETWSKILSVSNNARLCIKARQYADESIKRDHIRRFNKAGVSEDRLDLIGYSDTTAEHLLEYNRIDIALDTFPYNGTTTTFESLWMGVPVICLEGDVHASRVGASIMRTLGMNNLLAGDRDEYVNIARELAGNLDKLAELRLELRSLMLRSALMDSKAFTKKYEDALLSVWENT